jgi:hypothetical protein
MSVGCEHSALAFANELAEAVGGFDSMGRHGGRTITGETPALLHPEVGPASAGHRPLPPGPKTADYPGWRPFDSLGALAQ